MKPKTAIQREVVKISESLPPLTSKQKSYAIEHCFDHVGYRTKLSHITCMDCGAEFESLDSKATCPVCGRRLVIDDTRRQKLSTSRYFATTQRVRRFQVVRYVEVTQHLIKGQFPCYFSIEVCRMIYDVEGCKPYYLALKTNYYGRWVAGSGLELRNTNRWDGYSQGDVKYNIYPYVTYPTNSIHPKLRRNGFKGSLHGFNPRGLFDRLLINPRAETLFKARQYELLSVIGTRCCEMDTFWHSVKIALRNNYRVKDATMWFDYLEFLRHFGKDTHNAHYVCPKSLIKAHDYWDKRKRDDEAREAREKKIKELQRKNAELKSKSSYFGLSITSGRIKIIVLDSIEAYVEEGEVMHHCVASYLGKKKSLIMSARDLDTGERIETIEVSLKSFEVVQSRGVCNSRTDRHEEIISAVQSNMNKIRRIANSQIA